MQKQYLKPKRVKIEEKKIENCGKSPYPRKSRPAKKKNLIQSRKKLLCSNP